jgi:hypothetical protein
VALTETTVADFAADDLAAGCNAVERGKIREVRGDYSRHVRAWTKRLQRGFENGQ